MWSVDGEFGEFGVSGVRARVRLAASTACSEGREWMRGSIAGSAGDWCAARAAGSEPICRSSATRAKCACVFNAMKSEAPWLQRLQRLQRSQWFQWFQQPRPRCEVFVLKQRKALVPSEPDRSIHNHTDSIPIPRARLP